MYVCIYVCICMYVCSAEDCEKVVLKAAREFFNSSPSPTNHSIAMAEKCLGESVSICVSE